MTKQPWSQSVLDLFCLSPCVIQPAELGNPIHDLMHVNKVHTSKNYAP